MKGFMPHLFKACYLIMGIILASCSFDSKQEKTPVIYITDLYHPYNDPDDHFDLAALYAITQFEIKAIIIDCAFNGKIPGKIPIQQLNSLTKRTIPFYLGLKENLKSPVDKAEDQPENQNGCKTILAILKNSERKVTLITVGSLRDVTAAYNRDSLLFERKVEKLIIFAGEARNRDFLEYNVTLDKNAFIRAMNKIPNVYWVPCFDGGLWQNNGYASFWRDHHSVLLRGASEPILNYFLFAFTQSHDTVGYIPYLHKPVCEADLQKYILDKNIPQRSLWCCSVFPYFVSHDKATFPFGFESVSIKVDSNAVLNYSKEGNKMMRFKITDMTNYNSRMTTIYNDLISS